MSACSALVFNNVNTTQFDCVCKSVSASVGVPIGGYTGTQTKSGYTVSWNYNLPQKTLTIQCLDSPSMAPCSLINSKISGLVAACGVK